MNKYDVIEALFRRLCKKYNVPIPKISPALPADPCDFTDSTTVRINVISAPDAAPHWHAAHVFGHYLCCLHAVGDEAEDERGTWCDLVADAIGHMICD